MVILRGLGDLSLTYAEKAWDSGATMLEIPIQSADDVIALRQVAAAAHERGLSVGAGTVTSVEDVTLARDAGAAFTVSPGVDEDVILASLAAGMPTLPGVATASDIQRCVKLGLSWLKAFPADSLGINWLAAMRGPFPNVRFVATGGIGPGNIDRFLVGGAGAVGLSFSPTGVNRWDSLTELARGS